MYPEVTFSLTAGLSIIDIQGKHILARKGLHKFFDLKDKFVNGTQDKDLRQTDIDLKNIIFGNIKNSTSEVRILKLQKVYIYI